MKRNINMLAFLTLCVMVVADCSKLTLCDDCLSEVVCGWCGPLASGSCFTADANGTAPANGSCPHGEKWYDTSCPTPPPIPHSCQALETCKTCIVDPKCGWCGPVVSGTCMPANQNTNRSIPYGNYSCPAQDWIIHQCPLFPSSSPHGSSSSSSPSPSKKKPLGPVAVVILTIFCAASIAVILFALYNVFGSQRHQKRYRAMDERSQLLGRHGDA